MAEIVIVTGASSGIERRPRACSAPRGAAVVVNYRGSRDLAENVVADVKAAGGARDRGCGGHGPGGRIVRLFHETDKAFGP